MDTLFRSKWVDHGGESTPFPWDGARARSVPAHDVRRYTKRGIKSLAVTWAATAQLAARSRSVLPDLVDRVRPPAADSPRALSTWAVGWGRESA
jgi:hypothetical protein